MHDDKKNNRIDLCIHYAMTMMIMMHESRRFMRIALHVRTSHQSLNQRPTSIKCSSIIRDVMYYNWSVTARRACRPRANRSYSSGMQREPKSATRTLPRASRVQCTPGPAAVLT